MSADLLRRAAAALRERAEKATPGPWEESVLGSEGYAVMAANPNGGLRRVRVSRHGYEDWDTDKANAEYVASMHPAVALAVATWLDSHADIHVLRTCDERLVVPCPALAVARAYLGEDES